MLRGTTKIELKDVNTGEIQVFEKHNTVTGALQEIFNPVFGHLTTEATLSDKIPVYSSLLGGLLLFDTRITGDPLPVYAPKDVKLVGCARYNWSPTVPSAYAGSYDTNESVISVNTKTAKFVYNFTQSQGNGTINSVCLTHRNGGLGVYRSDFGLKDLRNTILADSVYASPRLKLMRDSRDRMEGIKGYGEHEHLFAVDVDNDIAYYFKLKNATTLEIVKRHIRLKQYSLFSKNADVISATTITVGTSISSNSATYNFDVEDNALYIISATSATVSPGSSFVLTKIVLNASAATQSAITNQHSAGLSPKCAYVNNGILYMLAERVSATINGASTGKYTVTKLPLSGGEISTAGSVYGANPVAMYAADGRIYWQCDTSSYQGVGGLQVTDGEETFLCGIDTLANRGGSSNYPISYTPVLNHPMMCYLSAAGDSGLVEGFYFLSHYLGTVNNLGTPITKTNTQTMKITYTIQEE